MLPLGGVIMRQFLWVLCLSMLFLLVGCSTQNGTIPVQNNPPSASSNPNPANNSTNVSITPTLSWTCTDPDGDSLVYDIYFGTSSNPPLVKSNHSSTSYSPGTLNYNTKYYWKIVAKDGKGGVSESPVWNFTTLSLTGSLSLARETSISREQVTGPIYSSPAMDKNGYLYVGMQGGLAKLDWNGILVSTPSASPVWSSPTIDFVTNNVYFADNKGTLFVLSQGQMTSRQVSSNSIYASPLIKDDYVYVVDLAGNVFRILKDLSDFSVLSLQREVRSSPVIVGNTLFVASVDGKICALDLTTGSKLWDKPFSGENFYGGFAIDSSGNLYIAGKKLWSLKSSDGSVNWSYELNAQAYANPVISSSGVIYIGDISGTLHAVELSGSRRWTKSSLGSILSSVVVGDNGVVYVCSDVVYAINPYDGSIISSLELRTFVESNPILHFGKLYVADEAGYFYTISALSETIEDPDSAWPMFQRDWYHTATR